MLVSNILIGWKKSSSNQSPRNLTQQNSENKFLKNEPTLARPVFVFLFFPNTKTGLYLTKLENMLLFESKSLKLETSYSTVIVAFPFGECFLLWVNGYKYLKFLLKLLLNLFVFLNWPNPASFCLFSFFLHDKYSTNTINEKSVVGVAWDSNPGWQDGRLRRIHWEMAAPQLLNFFTVSTAEQLYLFAQSLMLLNGNCLQID